LRRHTHFMRPELIKVWTLRYSNRKSFCFHPLFLLLQKNRFKNKCGGKIFRAPPKAVVKVSMLRDIGNRHIAHIKGGGESPIQHTTREEKSATPRWSPTSVVPRK
jgi:hypothetical protein